MKFSGAWIAVAMAMGPWVHAKSSDSATSPPPGNLSTWIEQLGDERFQVRENASRKIWDTGPSALPALREAGESGDPERTFRVRELIRRLHLQLTPETDPVIVALAERYAGASEAEKINLFAKLRVKRAWRQLLKLYADETSQDLRTKLLPSIQGVALKAARQYLVHGQRDAAREVLELATADPENLLALADYYRSQGQLDEQLARARNLKGPKSAAWKLALYRVSGDLHAAETAAREANEPDIAAAMAGLAGDPLPWLRHRQVPRMDRAAGHDSVLNAYGELAAKRWQGEIITPAAQEPLSKQLLATNAAERMAAVNALFLLGERSRAEIAFAGISPMDAFQYFESLERTPDALKALGLNPDHPDFIEWVKKRLAKLAAAPAVEDQQEPTTHSEELLVLANFFERRGLDDVARTALAEPMLAFAKKHRSAYLLLLSDWFDKPEALGGAPHFAAQFGMAWAGNDDQSWKELVDAAIGGNEQAIAWWEWMAELNPKAARRERFEGLLALFGIDPYHAAKRDPWLDLAWKAIAAAHGPDRDPLIANMAALAQQTGDVSIGLKAWDLTAADERDELFWGELIFSFAAAGRWNDVAAVFLKQIEQAEKLQLEPNVVGHAYAAAALRQAGRLDDAARHEQMVDELALGNASVAIQIGHGYAMGNDYARATLWWERAARFADPESSNFTVALKLFSESKLKSGRWVQAASTAEIVAKLLLSGSYQSAGPMPFLRQRLESDTARALSYLPDHRQTAIKILAQCHRDAPSDGSLADLFFPAVRGAGLIAEHDAWFQTSWDLIEQAIARYPNSHNTLNTAGWFAARAIRNLDAGEAYLRRTLAIVPRQAAYLDTMAEIQFAKGRRAQALDLSQQAVNLEPNDPDLRRQHEHFRADPIPR